MSTLNIVYQSLNADQEELKTVKAECHEMARRGRIGSIRISDCRVKHKLGNKQNEVRQYIHSRDHGS